jgi:O-antigen/teichoic acid export membrane protein
MNPQEPRGPRRPIDHESAHRAPHRTWRPAASQVSQIPHERNHAPIRSAGSEESWIERSSRMIPPANDGLPFGTGPLPVIKLPTKPLPDISEQPTMMLPAISLSPTTVLPRPDISDWPTQPALPRIPQRRAPLEDDDDLEILPTWILPVVTAAHPEVGHTGRHTAVVAGVQGYVALIVDLFKSSAVYALASLGAPLITLGLAPFLAHYLTKVDYGILTVMTTVIGLAAGITQLGLGSAFFRAYNFDYSTEHDRHRVLSTTLIILILVSSVAAVATMVTAPYVATLLFNQPGKGNLISLAAGVVLLQNLTVPGFSWLRAESRAGFYSVLSIANVIVALVANIVLVGVLHLGVAGSLMATGAGYATAAIVMMPVIVVRTGIRFRSDIAKGLLAFGLPLVLNFVSYWVLQLSDRYLLALFRSLSETANYSVAYTLGSAINVVVITPFTLAWPTTMYMIAKRGDARQIFRLLFRWLSMVLMFTAFALSLAGQIVLDQVFPASYRSAAPIIPVVAESLVFYGIYFILMAGANIRRKTWMAAIFTSVAAVVNLVLNLILIPRYGQMGAAVSTLVAYIILAALAYVANQRIYPVPYEILRFVGALAGGVAIFVCAKALVGTVGTRWIWQLNFLGLVLYAGWLLLLGTSGRVTQLGAVARLARRA